MSLDGLGNVIGKDIAMQTRNVFESLKHVLEAADATMANVGKHTFIFNAMAMTPRSTVRPMKQLKRSKRSARR